MHMVLRTIQGIRKAEDSADLRTWLRALPGAPAVHEVFALACAQHGDERPTWAYVEADATEGLARRRCLACATTVPLLDSAERWNYPPMWSCLGCSHSIAELAVALSLPDGTHVEWLALGARCVECGRLAGLTDLVVAKVALADVLTGL